MEVLLWVLCYFVTKTVQGCAQLNPSFWLHCTFFAESGHFSKCWTSLWCDPSGDPYTLRAHYILQSIAVPFNDSALDLLVLELGLSGSLLALKVACCIIISQLSGYLSVHLRKSGCGICFSAACRAEHVLFLCLQCHLSLYLQKQASKGSMRAHDISSFRSIICQCGWRQCKKAMSPYFKLLKAWLKIP